MVCGGISEWSVSFAEEAEMAIALSFVATAADKICNIYSMKILNGNFMLGGRGKKVEIDELMFGNKRKYNCGHVSEGQWVFGMVVRDTGQSLLFRVPDHQRETLVTRVLHEFNEPGTVIISDKLSPTTCRDSAVKWKGSWRRWMGPWEPNYQVTLTSSTEVNFIQRQTRETDSITCPT